MNLLNDYLDARREDVTPELALSAREFAHRVEIANRIVRERFADIPPPPQGPDRFQMTLMLIKLQLECEGFDGSA